MPESLLTVLKLCFLALLYLFFLRAIRVVWAAMSPAPVAAPTPAAAPVASGRRARKTAGAAPLRLKVLEPTSMKGQIADLTDEVTIGRASTCTLTIEDTFISQLHARVFFDNGQVFVEDLGSTNGTFLNRKKVTSATPVRRGDRIQAGKAILELAK
jgi:pSer/pThr/pTyr-binding forkhead associated (FHA) protein